MSSAIFAWGSVPVRTSKPAKSAVHRRAGYKPHVARGIIAARAAFATRVFLLAATALYLSIELPFAARLVGILATPAGGHEIETIERLGRFISGAALALALWGRFLPRWIAERSSLPAIAIRLAVLTALCIAGMMVGQRTLIDGLADAASPDRRKAALQGAVLRDAAIPLTPASDGAAQALTGSLPFLGLASADRFAALPARDAAIRAYAIQGFPTMIAYRDTAVAPASDKIRSAYRDYASASRRIVEARSKAYPQVERAWNELQDSIARRRLDVNNPSVRKKIIDQVNARGIPVFYDWHPYDRAGFFEAGLPNGEGSLRSALTQAFGKNDIPLGLPSLDAFVAQPAVQATLRKSLGLSETGPALRLSQDAGAMAGAYYAEARKRFGERLSAALTSKTSLDTDMSDRGRDAIRLAIAAAFGIVLSALGAAVHIGKLAYYAGSLLQGARRTAIAGAGLAAALMIALPLVQGLPASVPAPLGWAIGTHGLLNAAGHALDGSFALQATEALVRALPNR